MSAPPAGSIHSYTRGVCPSCRRVVDGVRIVRDGRVYARKHCPEHGTSEALVCGDAKWFLDSWKFLKPGTLPFAYSTEAAKGCPEDCGLCPEHEQHTCLPIIEITDHCNLECPICLVENRDSYHMSPQELGAILDGLVEKEGTIETVNFSGGEPTLHPRLLELLDLARRPEISRLSVSTNGVRLASSPELCAELARRGVYVNLQLDALSESELRSLRGGGDHLAVRRRALANLEAAGVRTTLISTVARGVNEHSIGECVELLLQSDFILSLLFQPAAYTGGGSCFAPHDPLDVVTIPDVVAAVEAETRGLIRREDFLPLPCSHPSCFALTYLLRTEDGWTPFPRFLDLGVYLELIANRGTLRPDARLEEAVRDAVDNLWSGADQVPDSDKILRALSNVIRRMYPEGHPLELAERLRIGEGLVKTVFVHAFMDEHTFEMDRIRKCCTHYALPDGRLMPGCAYNVFHRRREPRLAAPENPGGSL